MKKNIVSARDMTKVVAADSHGAKEYFMLTADSATSSL